MLAYTGPMKIFSGTANRKFAEDICKCLDMPLGEINIGKFSDGEINLSVEETVRGYDVYIIQPTCNPTNDNLMEVLIMVHAGQIQGYFDIPVDHLSAIKPLADFFKDELKDEDKKDMVVVSPDLGGVTRARNFSNYLDLPIAILEKRRPRPNVSEVMNVIGDIEGKTCIIVDDIIDTAGTITNAANALIAKGAKKVYITASHGVFSGKAIENISNSKVEKCVVTDTIPQEKNLGGKIEVVSVAQYFAKAIDRINNNRPVSMLFDGR